MKDLLKLLDLSRGEILEILDTADFLKSEWKVSRRHDFPAGKVLAMIFAKNSTRTRVSFETGIFQLGGTGIFLSNADSQLGRGEPIQDTARVLSRYCDCIMVRTYSQDEVEKLAEYADVPVINALTDMYHPCQVLADLQTIREHKGSFDGLKICYIGDGNNMANSIIVGSLKLGMDITAACPDGYHPHRDVLKYAKSVTDASFVLTND
ncbi:MAG: ornithine carbamoyltransferase, partial [Oscillospiraceae bacterium]|nr:ornithine carbamoyltransferase [Oscillospiraceae bacterium]